MYKTKNESFCSRRCRSVKHADEISSAILRGNEDQAIAFMCWRCPNYGRVADEAGRTALHIASSCGKTKVVEWILKNSDHEACLNAKDYESGYTPLHRSLFHGQLSVARSLIKHGAKMNALDHDGLIPLDHLMKDQPSMANSSSSAPCEVYVWGSNSNFNLGIGNHQIRRFPDTVDYFRKNNTSIKKVAMGKFHSIFVSHDGRAFSCGHGQGGRLGLDSEETVMTPNQINLSSHHSVSRTSDSKHVVVCASVGQDHSILLTEKGMIYTFGMNDHYQLGHNPPPPYQLSPKALPLTLNQAIGVNAGHYHSVAWSSTKLYTWGFNCGQLGHPKVSQHQIIPKLVAHLRGVEFVALAAGDRATVVASARGEVYILQDYSCRKIGFSLGLVNRIEIMGGRLDPALIKSADVSGWGDYRKGEDDLKVLIVNDAKKIMVWQSSTGQFARCYLHVGNRNVNAVDAALGMNRLLVVTGEGEGFEAEFKIKKKAEDVNLSSSPVEQTVLQKLIEKDTSLDFHLKRIGFVHRAVSVFCDPKGCNFSVIQVHPNFLTKKPEAGIFTSLETGLLSLLEDARESDFISDVVFCIGGTRIPAHRYILECNSKSLASLIISAEKMQSSSSLEDSNTEVDGDFCSKSQDVLTVKLENVHPFIFRELLKFVYTGVCDFCIPGNWSPEKDMVYSSFLTSDKESEERIILKRNCETADKGAPEDKSSSKTKVKAACGNKTESEHNPVNDARKAASRFGLNDMVKQMDGLQYNRNKCMIYRKSSNVDSQDEKPVPNICLNPQSCSHLYDVIIECNEGKLISAHKCILSMRSKYFETMLKGNWLECSGQRNLTLPFPFEVMETILLYLYQNKVSVLNKSEDLTFICHVLVAADQILLEGLKEICEISLANHVTLKNVSELYQFSDTYNAFKLKSFCMDYICHNLSALFESRALDSINSELFDDLQMCYWGMRPVVLDRYIALPNKYPDLTTLQSIWENVGIPSEEEHFKHGDHLSKSPPRKEVVDVSKRNKSKKKQRSKQNSIDENVELLSRLSLGSAPGSDIEISSERLDPSFCSLDDNIESFDESLQITCQEDLEKDVFQFNLELKLEENTSTPIKKQTSSHLESKSENKITSVIDEEFPSLSGDFYPASLSVTAKVPKQRKMVKLSQKARKKLLISPGITDETNDSPQDTSKPEINAWKRLNSSSQEEISPCSVEVQPLSEIMNEERMRRPKTRRTSQDECSSEENKFFPVFASSTSIESTQNLVKASLAKSSHWSLRQPLNECQVTGQKPFDEIIADELKQREITKKIMGKSLNLTQIEDRAIKELQLLYDREYEFDQRITVKRHCSAQASKPVWITSKSP